MRVATRLCLGFGLIALASGGLVAPAAAQDAPWRHGVLSLKSDAGFVAMVAQHDFAAKNGLDLKLVPLKNENLALRALVAGQLDSYEGSPPFQANARGLHLKVLGCYWVTLPHELFVRDGINKVSDLTGKTIATSAPGSLPSLLAQATLAHYKVPASSVKLAAVGGDADRYRALTGGVVDAAVISSEYTPFAEKEHVKALVPIREILPDYLRYCYVTTAEKLAQQPKAVAHFLAAEMTALRYALQHKDETVALAKSSAGQKPDDPRAAFIFDEVVRTHAVDPTLPLSEKKIESMQKILLDGGILQKKVDIEEMVAPKPREQALAEVGGK